MKKGKFNVKNMNRGKMLAQQSKKYKRTTAKLTLKLYPITEDMVKGNSVKVFLTILPDGLVTINLSLEKGSVICRGLAYLDSYIPENEEKWQGRLFVNKVIPECVTGDGVLDVFLTLNRENDKMTIRQQISRVMREEGGYETVFVTGSSRTNQVKSVLDLIKVCKESRDKEDNEPKTE